MANLTNLALAVGEVLAPHGWWASLYNWFEGFIINYGWTIFVFTVFVRLILLPLDFYNRYSTRKNNFIQKRLAGQVQKINERNSQTREKANQEVSALYKKEGYNMIGTCLFTIVNLVVTLIVFFSFFNTLRDISAYKMLNQYSQIEQAYQMSISNGDQPDVTKQIVVEKYNELKENSSWMWVNNIWRFDSNNSRVPNYDELKKAVNSANDKQYKQYFNPESELYINPEQYNTVMQPVIDANPGWNGYFIIPVLAALLSFLTQYLTELSNRTKKDKKPAPGTPEVQMQASMKVMKILLPAVMLIFALTNTASFGIYLIASSLIGIVTNFIIGFFVKKLTKKEEKKYLAYLEKEALHSIKKQTIKKPQMVNYKKIGDRA